MGEKFIAEPIKVVYDFDSLKPVSFTWDKKEYKIAELINAYQDFGFSSVGPKKKNWRIRHHRNYYIIKTADGEKFRLYLDRAKGKRQWILLSKYG